MPSTVSMPSTFLTLALLTGMVPPAAGQGSSDTSDIPHFGDSVRAVMDTAGLAVALERTNDDRSLSPAVRETRKGWIALRLGGLGSGRDRLDEAVRYFDEAIFRDDDRAEAWVGLAETKLLLEQRHAVVKISMHQQQGQYYEDAALLNLATALRHRPTYPAAVALLARLLIDFDAPDFPDQLGESIRLASAHPENGPLPQLFLGRYLRKQHQMDAAVRSFQLFATMGGDPGLGSLELARTIYQAGNPDSAVTLYMGGAYLGDTLARTAFRRDFAWLATPEELIAFDSLPADSVGPWLRFQWESRDAASLRPAGDRLKEHLRRWWYVQEHYQLVGRRKKARFGWGISAVQHVVNEDNAELGFWALFAPGTLPESDPRSLGVDDRGLIYLRHGEPDARVSSVGEAGRGGCWIANESWKYDLPTGPIVLNFCASEALGSTAPTTLVPLLPLDPDMFGARIGLDIQFGIMEMQLRQYLAALEMRAFSARAGAAAENAGAEPPHPTVTAQISDATTRQLQERGKASIRLGLTTDTYPLEYKSDLAPTVQIYGSSNSAEAGQVLIVFAIPGDRIAPAFMSGRLVYPIQMRVTAVDTTQGIVRALDTLRYFVVPDTLRNAQYLYGTLTFGLAPGSYFIRALLEQSSRSAAGAVGRADVIVPGTAQSLTMSDLITGTSGGVTWEHLGHHIALNALDAYRSGSTIELYYEIVGANAGSDYVTTINLVRTGSAGGGGKDRLNLTFTEHANGRRVAIERSVDLHGLIPGRYLLTVTTTARGATPVSREKIINVLPRE